VLLRACPTSVGQLCELSACLSTKEDFLTWRKHLPMYTGAGGRSHWGADGPVQSESAAHATRTRGTCLPPGPAHRAGLGVLSPLSSAL